MSEEIDTLLYCFPEDTQSFYIRFSEKDLLKGLLNLFPKMLAGLCAVMSFSSCESDYKKNGVYGTIGFNKKCPLWAMFILVVLYVQFASRVIGNRARD